MKVEDLGSSNGTYINGERVQQAELAAGDTLAVGPVIFVAQVNGFPADDDLQPVTAASAAASTKHSGAPAAADDEEEIVDLENTTDGSEPVELGEFDPMEALESKEGSAFDFQIDESQHGDSPVDLEESDQK
jgi:predicted component of type VI protein secretion system